MSESRISVRVEKELADRVDRAAKDNQKSKTDFVKMVLEFFTALDPEFLSKVQASADQVKVPLHIFIQNKLIKMYAKEAAELEVWGAAGRVLPEFMSTENGTITGEELFDALKGMYVHVEKRKLKEVEWDERNFPKGEV